MTPRQERWHMQCFQPFMPVELNIETSQTFDDSFVFQRLTLIDICCGPPAAA